MFLPALVFMGIAAGGWVYLRRMNQTKAKFAQFILDNPETTAIVAATFDAQGEWVTGDAAMFYNADHPLLLASTMKIVVLAAYANAVAKGDLDPNRRVPVADWEAYYLPNTDGGAHGLSLKSMRLKAKTNGFAENPAATVSFDDLARVMIHYSENASTDYLIAHLGEETIAGVMQKIGLATHTPISLTLGPALAGFNHENPSFSLEYLRDLTGDNSQAKLNRLVTLYRDDPDWRAAQIAFMFAMNLTALSGETGWAYQEMVSQLFSKGTAREYAKMMGKIASGTLISPEVSTIIQKKLETVLSDGPLRALFFRRFGAKDGTTAGVLTMASYAVPKRGPLRGQSRAVVLLANQMPPTIWAEQVQGQGHYLLPLDLAQATGLWGKLNE